MQVRIQRVWTQRQIHCRNKKLIPALDLCLWTQRVRGKRKQPRGSCASACGPRGSCASKAAVFFQATREKVMHVQAPGERRGLDSGRNSAQIVLWLEFWAHFNSGLFVRS